MSVKKLHKLSSVMPSSGLDSVKLSKRMNGEQRAFDVLFEAQQYWLAMDTFRRDRERNKNYAYGRQWDDYVCVDGRRMKEEDYITKVSHPQKRRQK